MSVAILGPDGSGKSTILQGIERASAVPARVYYMGLSDARLPRLARLRVPFLREVALLVTLWTRYTSARLFRASGGLVLFDRYTYDALLPARHPLTRMQRLSRWIRAHSCPPPDLLFILDVPGQIMYQRKGEHSPHHLEAERNDFRALARRLSAAQLVNADRPHYAILTEIQERIEHGRMGKVEAARHMGEMRSAVIHAGLGCLPTLGRAQRRRLGRRQLREARRLTPDILQRLPAHAAGVRWKIQKCDWTRTDVAVLTLGPEAGEPEAFLKMPWTPASADSLQTHAAILAALQQDQRLESWRSLLPRMLSAGIAGSRPYWLEQALPGREGRRHVYSPGERHALHRAAAGAITELHRKTAAPLRADTPTLQSWVCEPIERLVDASAVGALPESAGRGLERLGRELTDALGGRELIRSWVHGDFWASNLLLDSRIEQVTGILDWDRANPAGLPVLDLIHLLVQTRKLLAGASEQGEMIRRVLQDGWTRSELEILQLGLLPFPLDSSANRVVMLLYWLDRMAILLRQDPARGSNRHWVARNIEPVLSCL